MSDLRNKQYQMIRAYEELKALNSTNELLFLVRPNGNDGFAITNEFKKKYVSYADMTLSPAYLNYTRDLRNEIAALSSLKKLADKIKSD